MWWVVNATSQSLYFLDTETLTILRKAGWASGMVWTGAEIVDPHRVSSPGPSSESLYNYAMAAAYFTAASFVRKSTKNMIVFGDILCNLLSLHLRRRLWKLVGVYR